MKLIIALLMVALLAAPAQAFPGKRLCKGALKLIMVPPAVVLDTATMAVIGVCAVPIVATQAGLAAGAKTNELVDTLFGDSEDCKRFKKEVEKLNALIEKIEAITGDRQNES